jgi:urea transporter/murein DD-endopeptidase MepM/ murein hydrolase activator NlpD
MNSFNLLNILRAYSAILFLQSPVAGLVILAATLFYPNVGLAGLLAAITGFTVTRLLQFPDYSGHIQIFNSLLVGLSLGAFYQLNIYVIGIIILGAILASILSTVLADWLWRLDRLPVLSLPFVIVAGVMALVARNYTELSDYMGLAESSFTLINPLIDTFFSALGAIYFTPTPIAGFILFVALTFYSRYLSFLAIIGYAIGYSLLTSLMFEPHHGFVVWTSFNFILVAIALGGILTVPSISSLIFAIVGVLLTVLLVIATKNLLLIEGLPVMAISFSITTLMMLMAMKKRMGISKPYLAPEPGLPEINYEKARLAKYRYGDINSVPLLTPVYGSWSIYQGFNGKYSHKPPWQYALDFFILNEEQSFDNQGQYLEDFYCFAAPVLSPAHGDVVRIYDRLPDNPPGEVDTKNNWGNFILIRLDSGLNLLLAHLQQGSIKVKEGERVEPGKNLAACGNSGRSPQPHLHMQIQRTAELGSPTCPFHLCSVMQYKADDSLEYQVVYTPEEGDRFEATTADDQLSNQLHLPVGRQFAYQVSSNFSDSIEPHQLTVEINLLGQFRLTSDTQASAAFEENNGVLAFYDRKGGKDILLNMWVLANGLTPLTEMAHHWSDSPSAMLLPLSVFQKFWLSIFRPLGCGLNSQYQRHWDQEKSVWVQQGSHQIKIGTNNYTAQSQSIIDPVVGVKDVSLEFNGKSWHAELLETGLIEDRGIPQWSEQPKQNSAHE